MRHDDPLDTYLLRVLCTLVEERSVSRTAIRMNQSQPALSSALKRLRKLFDDPLLTREKNEMVPTERALQLAQDARVALNALDKMFSADDAFDPQRTDRTFTIAMPDYLAPPFFADLARRFRQHAPNAKLVTLPMGTDYDYEKALAEGQVDVVIGNWPTPPEHLHMNVLLEDEIVCLMSKDNPLAKPGRLTAESYIDASHLVPLPYSSSQRGVPVLQSRAVPRQRVRPDPDHRAAFRGLLRAPPAAADPLRAVQLSADALLRAVASEQASLERARVAARAAVGQRRAADADRRHRVTRTTRQACNGRHAGSMRRLVYGQ